MKFAVFIDRDGTINEEVGYVDSPDKFHLLPGVSEAIRRLNDQDIPAIIISNQSGIARGYFSADFVNRLHMKMTAELEKQGCRINGIYVCPHHPNDGCACRKPRPGMLLKAAKEHGITLHSSYVIGDKIIDIQTAHGVGAKGILVMTGYGAEELRKASMSSEGKPDHVAANLKEAVTWIIEEVAHSIREIPLNPPFSKGETFFPPLVKGGGGGFEGEKANNAKKSILIVKPSSLGDIIHSLPVLWELRKKYPDACIGWVVKEVWQDILSDNPLIDHLIVLRKGIKGIIAAIQEIRKLQFDTVIDLQGLFRSGLITYFSGASVRTGLSTARESAPIFYNNKVPVPPGKIHAVDRYLLAVTNREKRDLKFPIYINIDDDQWAIKFLLENNLSDIRPLIAINPSARWVKKRWPAASYSDLINQLIKELKAGIIIIGSKDDIAIANDIASHLNDRIVIATGKTNLRRLAALLEKVDLLITNDSGPMHIAAALGTAVVALFGPTDPVLTGPYGKGHIVLRKDLECSPCLRKPCKKGRPVCMEAITAEDVLKAVTESIKIKGDQHGVE
ncbi:MAG: lipopolysaccharide heptosyltransferase II [Nitrospirae bacterium]|nr:lipopolysaccharide heptosyltransferase II [Nitrospirota bacterium]